MELRNQTQGSFNAETNQKRALPPKNDLFILFIILKDISKDYKGPTTIGKTIGELFFLH